MGTSLECANLTELERKVKWNIQIVFGIRKKCMIGVAKFVSTVLQAPNLIQVAFQNVKLDFLYQVDVLTTLNIRDVIFPNVKVRQNLRNSNFSNLDISLNF